MNQQLQRRCPFRPVVRRVLRGRTAFPTLPLSMAKIPPFHSEVDGPAYNPREVWVFHNHARCGYGHRVIRDGNAQEGRGMTPEGFVRTLCLACEGQSYRERPVI